MPSQNTRFAWTPAVHNVYQKAVDHLGGPENTTVAYIVAAIPASDLELFGLEEKRLKRVLQSYLQRDRDRLRALASPSSRAPKRRRTATPADEATTASAQGAARMVPSSAPTEAVAANGDAPPAAHGPAPGEGNTEPDSGTVTKRRRRFAPAEPSRLGIATAMALVAAGLRVPHGEHIKKLAERAYAALSVMFEFADSNTAVCALPGRVANVTF